MPRKNSLANVVQETNEYDRFTFMVENRDQARGHIETLKKAFEEVGNLTRVQPILVNDRMQIIDGQHRFVACKELGLPIYYTVVEGLGINEARSMNILHRNWTVIDFAQSYAASGNKHYKLYLELREDYGFAHSATLVYAVNGEPGGMYKDFREGLTEIPDEKGARQRLEKLAEVGEFTPLVRDKNFARAFRIILQNEEYSQKRMIQKLVSHADRLKRFATVEDNLRQLEDLYNYSMAQSNRVRLY